MTIRKQFRKLPKDQKEGVETEYHRMKPEEFDGMMSRAKRHTPIAIRLPQRLVRILKRVARSEGELEYQTMVRRWIEERLQQKTSARS